MYKKWWRPWIKNACSRVPECHCSRDIAIDNLQEDNTFLKLHISWPIHQHVSGLPVERSLSIFHRARLAFIKEITTWETNMYRMLLNGESTRAIVGGLCSTEPLFSQVGCCCYRGTAWCHDFEHVDWLPCKIQIRFTSSKKCLDAYTRIYKNLWTEMHGPPSHCFMLQYPTCNGGWGGGEIVELRTQ